MLEFKRKESAKHKKQGEYHSPVNFMTVYQREQLNNGNLAKNIPFQLNPKIATLPNFFDCIKNSNEFVLVSHTQNKDNFSLLTTKEEFAPAVSWMEGVIGKRKQIREENIQSYKNTDTERKKNVGCRKNGNGFFNNKDYKNAVREYEKENFCFMLPLEQADHYYNIGRSYEELGGNPEGHAAGNFQQALKNFQIAEKIYQDFLPENNDQLKKTRSKIENILKQISASSANSSSNQEHLTLDGLQFQKR